MYFDKIDSAGLIAPCGMNCALCIGYQRKKKPCAGCNLENTNKPKHCIQCHIKTCNLLEQTSSGFCYDCTKYPCTRLKQLDKRYRTKYRMIMLENLDFIKSQGMNAFLEQETRRWSCLDCGQLASVHRENCQHCGADTSESPY